MQKEEHTFAEYGAASTLRNAARAYTQIIRFCVQGCGRMALAGAVTVFFDPEAMLIYKILYASLPLSALAAVYQVPGAAAVDEALPEPKSERTGYAPPDRVTALPIVPRSIMRKIVQSGNGPRHPMPMTTSSLRTAVSRGDDSSIGSGSGRGHVLEGGRGLPQ